MDKENYISKDTAQIVNDLLKDYESEERFINQVELFDQPDTDEVKNILDKLIKIVFPGFFRERHYRFYNLRSQVNILIEDVVFNLNRQIVIALGHCPEYENKTAAEIEEASTAIINEFLKQIPKVRRLIETDIEATFDGDPAAFDRSEIVLSYPGLYAIAVSRIAHELFLLNVPLIPRIMTEHAHSKTGIDIHPGTTIGEYFFIDHGTGIVIGETSIIGDHVKVYQGVTIGALSTRGGQRLKGVKRHPTIEDEVTIYAGASILGGDTIIGKGAVIGSNAFITSSINPGARVSIKNQELSIKEDSEKIISAEDLTLDEGWFYTI